MQNTKKRLLAFFLSVFAVSMIALPAYSNAAIDDPEATNYGLEDSDFQTIGLGKDTELKTVISNVINIALGFLGIIAVLIIIYAGFKWMTASGNEEQVSEARKMLLQAVIGLVIIFLAWGISSFVITQLKDAT